MRDEVSSFLEENIDKSVLAEAVTNEMFDGKYRQVHPSPAVNG